MPTGTEQNRSARAGKARAAGGAAARLSAAFAALIRGQVVKHAGGPVRARVIVLFAITLGLNGADQSTVGAVGPQLEAALHISNTEVGLLSSAALGVGALATIPVGMLVDRIRRMPLLALSIVLWSIASLLGAFASNYTDLLISRLLLGAVIATAGPAVASLTGDYFPAGERGRVWAYVLAGEMLGNALGVMVCGTLASATSWRASFILLALPGVFLAWTLYRTVPEPERGGQSHLYPGAHTFADGGLYETVAFSDPPATYAGASQTGQGQETPAGIQDDRAREAARKAGVEPDPEKILHQDPRTLGLREAVSYVLSIPSNVLMIVSNSLGYFFFGALNTFAVLYIRGHYHSGQVTAELVLGALVTGAIIGTLLGGRITDLMLDRGFLNGRVWVPAVCYLLGGVILIPGFVLHGLGTALIFDIVGAAMIGAANPPLNAARLDIMPAGLWGRAESIRTFVRSIAEALAPLICGGLSDLIAGVIPEQTPVAPHTVVGAINPSETRGLEITFLVFLATVLLAGFFLVRSRLSYPSDVATAAASHQGTD
ncbi:MAG: MFS transporter [Solirubrobacterales bacterium]|nr:MFS transporter [Solirubrobacterales bacterium]